MTVFSWGENYEGQLGLGHDGEDEALPQKVETFSGLKVFAVAGGYETIFAVTAAGELYTWGAIWTARAWRRHRGSACAEARGGPPR